ncbi:MAG: VOC family protein [Methanomassiliicoccales archaeon]
MPIGDPLKDDTQFDHRGNLENIWMVTVPVSDLERSITFYVETLELELRALDQEHGWAEIAAKNGNARLALSVSSGPFGKDTGLIFATNSIFDLHRKLVDREVQFTLKPTKVDWLGVLVEFLDPDGNRLRTLEGEGHEERMKPAPRPPKEEASLFHRTIITRPPGRLDKV